MNIEKLKDLTPEEVKEHELDKRVEKGFKIASFAIDSTCFYGLTKISKAVTDLAVPLAEGNPIKKLAIKAGGYAAGCALTSLVSEKVDSSSNFLKNLIKIYEIAKEDPNGD